MHLIVCLDDSRGMSFCGRRLSMDALVREDMLRTAGRLYMTPYSAGQFDWEVCAVEDPLTATPEECFCFIENIDPAPFVRKARSITVYLWNRRYPSDQKFPELSGWRCESRREFPGKSHDTITREVYIPCSEEEK